MDHGLEARVGQSLQPGVELRPEVPDGFDKRAAQF